VVSAAEVVLEQITFIILVSPPASIFFFRNADENDESIFACILQFYTAWSIATIPSSCHKLFFFQNFMVPS
jgi:hypothetical protein